MAVKLNKKGVCHARKLIEAGKVNKTSAWSFDASDSDKILGDNNWENYSKWFLGQDTEAPEKN